MQHDASPQLGLIRTAYSFEFHSKLYSDCCKKVVKFKNSEFMKLHGIDFSGNVQMWRPRCQRSNVWVATAEFRAEILNLVALRRVQDLPGSSHPFKRLADFLYDGDYYAAAIDAPFSLPARHMPAGGFSALLQDIAKFKTDQRPFAEGKILVSYGKSINPLKTKKPMRMTEQVWKEKGVNVRSTLWDGPRGGAPFTVACLTLLAKARRPVWPWDFSGPGLLVESFPAAQLHQWNLPSQNYSRQEDSETRLRILDAITQRIHIPSDLHTCCRENGDALDSVLCLFSALAVARNLAQVEESLAVRESWIAVHP